MDQTEIKISHGEGKYKINISAIITGDGVAAVLTGGERPHVGGSALSVPRSGNDAGKNRYDTWITPRPGHRDADVAALVARIICEDTGMTAAVTAGIHIDNASREEINILIENSREAARLLTNKIKGLG